MPNKAVEDDGDTRVFFGLREVVTGDACFAHSPAPAPLPLSRFSHRASPLTLASKEFFTRIGVSDY